MGKFKMKIFYVLVMIAIEVMALEPRAKVQPEKYEIFIQTSEKDFKDNPDNEILKFSGTVTITFKYLDSVRNDVNFFVNGIPETEIKSYELRGVKGHQRDNIIQPVTLNQKEGLIILNVKNLSSYESYEIFLNFTNPYQKDMTGFYRSYYRTPENNTRWLVTTHFEPIYARKAFPCFDDPSLKATFKLSIAYPKSLSDHKVLCNAPQESFSSGVEFNMVKCNETLFPMSTYLVAFAITDFHESKTVYFSSDYPNNIPSNRNLTTYGRKSIISAGEAEHSLNVGKEALELLQKYLKKGYAFEKVDFIGIPDFSVGAMENWGLITYREKILFYNESTGSAYLKQSNTLTIVHELVHQWFGNLVTLANWDYIWLNEAFASYLSYVIASQIKNPNTDDWGYMKQILNKEIHFRAFETDGLPAARSLSHKHKNESTVSSAFDDIPYAKGAAILRMWDLTLPEKSFVESLIDYIEKNQNKNVVPDDLYSSFNRKTKMDVGFFKTWHENPGYPVISVKKNGNIYKLSQARFFWEKPDPKIENTKYVVPITYFDAGSSLNFDTVANVWLKNDEIELSIKGKWFIINNQQAGYYRVNYEKENWLALAEALNGEDRLKIHELNRAQIINDVYSLARSVHKDYVEYYTALNLSMFLKNEESYIVWKSAFNAFDFLLSKVSQEKEISNNLKAYILELVKPHFKPLNEKGKDHLDTLKRTDMARWACALNYEPCLQNAKTLYSDASKYPNVEEIIYCNAVKVDSKAWGDIFEKYKKVLDSSKKMMYLSALGCSSNESIIQSYLNMTISEDLTIRMQDRASALASIYGGNSKNVEMAFKFIENNYKFIASGFGGINPLGKVLTGIAKNLHSDNDIKRMEQLVERIKQSESLNIPSESLANAISIVKSNQEWLEKRAQYIRKYFNSSSTASHSILLIFFSLIFIFRF